MCRLGHKKSRKGCIACKRRRVKCDEQAPCRNCTRRGEQCSLVEPSPSTQGGDKEVDGFVSADEWMEDLRLLRHFVRTTTLEPLGATREVQQTWQDVVSEEATHHPFLMHGVLALSALHIIHKRPEESERHLRLCDNHQSKALESFRSILSSKPTEKMSAPMFALASVISISSVARSCATALVLPEPKYVSMEQVAELFLLTRGVRTVVEACDVWLRASPLAPMLDGYDIPRPDEVSLPEVINDRFRALYGMIESTVMEVQEKRFCQEALLALEGIYRSVSHYEAKDTLQTGHVFTWMTSIPMEFVTFIQASFPPALVILAHFASVSLAARSAWYSRNWGNYCLQGIAMELRGHELQPWLEWPMAHAQSNMAIVTPFKIDEDSPSTYRVAGPTP